MIDNIEVGRSIARLRQNRGMTQQQLAAALNVSHQAVSKWENGAALPDVQTLMNLTGLFGVTMEQLLNGEIPEDRTAPEGRNPIEEGLQNVGNYVNSFMNGLFAGAKGEKDAEAAAKEGEAPAEAEASVEAEEPHKEEEAAGEEAAGEEAENKESFNLENLLSMAPFMTRQAVGELLMEHRAELSSDDIAKFAPFITRECLEELIRKSDTEFNWDTLRHLAPFLKREMVDRLAWVTANGKRIVKQTGEQVCNPEELGRSLGEMSQRIGAGVEKALRKAARMGEEAMNEAGKAINDMLEGMKTREERTAALRRAAMERALQDEKWDWIAAHLEEADEEMKNAIVRRARETGHMDWVMEHLEDYADAQAIEEAIENGDWGWLGDHLWQLGPEDQQKVALAAVQANHWLWLTSYAELLTLDGAAAQVAGAAYDAGEKALALTLAKNMIPDQLEAFAAKLAEANDDDALAELMPCLDAGYADRLCLARAKDGNWDGALRFVGQVTPETVERLTEQAIGEGNFDAIDRLNEYL